MRSKHEQSIYWVKFAICAAALAEMLLTPKLWLSSRLYPLAPVFPFLRPVSPPFDAMVFGALLLLLVRIALAARPAWEMAAFVVLAAGYGMWDQTRWQPWFYQNAAMLAVLGWAYARSADPARRETALQACRWMIAAIYFWSGLHKFNDGFTQDAFPWVMEPFGRWLPEMVRSRLPEAAVAAAVVETLLGAALMTPRFRRAAAIGAVAMHGFILASVGPWGHNFDTVVWPWNLGMIALLVLLFRPTAGLPQWSVVPVAAVVLFWALPALSFADWVDGYLSFSLYSGNNNSATIYMSDGVADRLPETVQDVIDVYESGVDELQVMDWSYAELNVPPYAEPRVFREIGRQVCAMADNPPEMALVVRRKVSLWRRRRLETYGCAALRRRN